MRTNFLIRDDDGKPCRTVVLPDPSEITAQLAQGETAEEVPLDFIILQT